MIYARVHDATVEADYRQAMGQIQPQHLPLSDVPLSIDNWPTRTQPQRTNHFLKEPVFDNSV